MSLRILARTLAVSLRAMVVATVVLGIGYTLLITAVGQLALPWQAGGSLVTDSTGRVVGSALIGQSFADAEGVPLAQYLQSRPSAAGDGYDAGASGGSNEGPENATLIEQIAQRQAAIATRGAVAVAAIPADAVTASASGLDPHISPEYALLQVPRIAAARDLDEATVREMIESRIQSRDLGYLGQPRVNVLEVNLALDRLEG